jgi:glycosyltransferase involved in cell wall biosynthesis
VRILLAGTEMTPVEEGRGGLEHLVLGWAAELSARHEVVVASVGATRSRPGEPFGRARFRDLDDLARLAAGMAADVVHLNNRPGWARFVPRAVVTLHNFAPAWPDSRRPESASELRRGFAAAAAVTAVSRALAASAAGLAPAAVTPPFADDVFFEARREAPRPWVTCPGRLLRKKGVETALAASARLDPDLEMVFTDFIAPWTAPTREHAALRRLVSMTPRCRLVPPPATRRAYADLLARSAVVIAPSIQPEGFGLVSIEAQAAGAPVVVSDAGGLPETVPDLDCVVPAGDPAALAAAIARQYGRAADPAWVRQRFSRRRSAEALEAVFRTVCPVAA